MVDINSVQSCLSQQTIFMMEDHNDAYRIWRGLGLNDKTLIHIDAHIDFGWFAKVNPLDLLQSKNLEEFNKLVKNVNNWNPSPNPKDTKPEIGNYINPSIKEGVIKKFYWVIPNDFLDTPKKLKFWKKAILQTAKQISQQPTPVIIEQKRILTRFYNAEVTVCDLKDLPHISEKVLLDIDTDFLLTDFKRVA